MKENSQKTYHAPSLTVYGSAEKITAEQSSAGSDSGFYGDDAPDSAYSVPPQ